MPSPADSTTATGAVREAIDPRRFSWIRPLVSDYADNFARVAPLFAGNPADPAAWRSALARVTGMPRDRAAVVAALVRQLDRRGAPAAARTAAADVATSETVCIVTGQEAGVFGGPLYTLLKAVTAIQLSRHVTATHGVRAIPVFWIESEDHDWAEIRSARVLDKDFNIVDVAVPDLPGAGRIPVARLTFEDSVGAALGTLAGTLAPSEFSSDVIALLSRHYQAGRGVATAFAGLLDELLGSQGLVVFEADDPSVKPLVRDLFVRELEQPRIGGLAREAAALMTSLGHAPQVESADDGTALFYLDEQGRRPIKRRDDGYAIGDAVRPAADVLGEARAHPERFGPNVLMRPLVQDSLFPTVAYVTGPSELAYHAQLGTAYEALRIARPLLYQRVSATLLDSGAARFFERSALPLEALQARDDSALNRLLESQLPPGLDRGIASAEQAVIDHLRSIRAAIESVDATLGGVVDTTETRMRDSLKTLQAKVVQAAKKKDETLRRQFSRTRTLVFPDGVPQERSLNVAYFLNRYGPGLAGRLLDVLPIETDKHYVISL